jgi:Relaxase/Mobilisation nuclease domain.
VIVATHLDKTHLHSHFVLNSVSFSDGKCYNDCKATYGLLRDTSDHLCGEYGFSVIENP